MEAMLKGIRLFPILMKIIKAKLEISIVSTVNNSLNHENKSKIKNAN